MKIFSKKYELIWLMNKTENNIKYMKNQLFCPIHIENQANLFSGCQKLLCKECLLSHKECPCKTFLVEDLVNNFTKKLNKLKKALLFFSEKQINSNIIASIDQNIKKLNFILLSLKKYEEWNAIKNNEAQKIMKEADLNIDFSCDSNLNFSIQTEDKNSLIVEKLSLPLDLFAPNYSLTEFLKNKENAKMLRSDDIKQIKKMKKHTDKINTTLTKLLTNKYEFSFFKDTIECEKIESSKSGFTENEINECNTIARYKSKRLEFSSLFSAENLLKAKNEALIIIANFTQDNYFVILLKDVIALEKIKEEKFNKLACVISKSEKSICSDNSKKPLFNFFSINENNINNSKGMFINKQNTSSGFKEIDYENDILKHKINYKVKDFLTSNKIEDDLNPSTHREEKDFTYKENVSDHKNIFKPSNSSNTASLEEYKKISVSPKMITIEEIKNNLNLIGKNKNNFYYKSSRLEGGLNKNKASKLEEDEVNSKNNTSDPKQIPQDLNILCKISQRTENPNTKIDSFTQNSNHMIENALYFSPSKSFISAYASEETGHYETRTKPQISKSSQYSHKEYSNSQSSSANLQHNNDTKSDELNNDSNDARSVEDYKIKFEKFKQEAFPHLDKKLFKEAFFISKCEFINKVSDLSHSFSLQNLNAQEILQTPNPTSKKKNKARLPKKRNKGSFDEKYTKQTERMLIINTNENYIKQNKASQNQTSSLSKESESSHNNSYLSKKMKEMHSQSKFDENILIKHQQTLLSAKEFKMSLQQEFKTVKKIEKDDFIIHIADDSTDSIVSEKVNKNKVTEATISDSNKVGFSQNISKNTSNTGNNLNAKETSKIEKDVPFPETACYKKKLKRKKESIPKIKVSISTEDKENEDPNLNKKSIKENLKLLKKTNDSHDQLKDVTAKNPGNSEILDKLKNDENFLNFLSLYRDQLRIYLKSETNTHKYSESIENNSNLDINKVLRFYQYLQKSDLLGKVNLPSLLAIFISENYPQKNTYTATEKPFNDIPGINNPEKNLKEKSNTNEGSNFSDLSKKQKSNNNLVQKIDENTRLVFANAKQKTRINQLTINQKREKLICVNCKTEFFLIEGMKVWRKRCDNCLKNTSNKI